jgi:putative membrane protein
MYWGPGWGWIFGLVTTVLFIAAIVVAAVFLARELSHPRRLSWGRSPALRLLEERYARGEISREEFLERRSVLLAPIFPESQSPGPTPTTPDGAALPATPEPPATRGEPPGPEEPPDSGDDTRPIPPAPS